jgi:phosphoribosylanthranilate isomerase
MTKVKICGITTIEDALAAIEYGADALGFVFAESPRTVNPEGARSIIEKLPPFVTTVGVFVNEEASVIERTVREVGLSAVQLHGEESPLYVESLRPLHVIKAVGVRSKQDLVGIERYKCSALLLDAKVEEVAGGSGKTFDWSILEGAVFERPVVLAGGLTADNVGEAVRRVRPYAVDVSTGVERSPGRKDRELLKRFISNAKSA